MFRQLVFFDELGALHRPVVLLGTQSLVLSGQLLGESNQLIDSPFQDIHFFRGSGLCLALEPGFVMGSSQT